MVTEGISDPRYIAARFRKFKRNMHIEIAVDAMELAEKVDQIVLFSGDGDFRSFVKAIQRRRSRRPRRRGFVKWSNASQPSNDCRRVAAASGCLYRFG